MAKSKSKKFYAVAKGRKAGIFETWDECKAQVEGFSASRYKSFKTRQEAVAFLQEFQGTTCADSSKQGDNRKRKESMDLSSGNSKKSRTEDASSDSINNDTTIPFHPPMSGLATTAGLTFQVHFDGGARGNPGVAGAGAEIVLSRATVDGTTKSKQSKTVVRRLCKTLIRHYLGDTFTNNQAEYKGLICGLENVLDTLRTKQYPLQTDERVSLIVQGDSKLVIQQVRGAFECKSPKLQSYYRSAKELLRSIQKECQEQTGMPCQLTLEHVYRESNKVADCKSRIVDILSCDRGNIHNLTGLSRLFLL